MSNEGDDWFNKELSEFSIGETSDNDESHSSAIMVHTTHDNGWLVIY